MLFAGSFVPVALVCLLISVNFYFYSSNAFSIAESLSSAESIRPFLKCEMRIKILSTWGSFLCLSTLDLCLPLLTLGLSIGLSSIWAGSIRVVTWWKIDQASISTNFEGNIWSLSNCGTKGAEVWGGGVGNVSAIPWIECVRDMKPLSQ